MSATTVKSTAGLSPDGNSASAYRARKRQELELLAEYTRSHSQPAGCFDRPLAIVERKQALRTCLQRDFLEQTRRLSESSLQGDERFELVDGQLRYTYQRFDLRLERPQFHRGVYLFAEAISGESIGLYTSCGMAAIHAALSALDAVVSEAVELLLARDSYFETLQCCRRFFDRLHIKSSPGSLAAGRPTVLYLDSICAEDPWSALDVDAALLKRVELVMIDTTCYQAGSRLLESRLRQILEAGTPTLLLRSHIKLDCLGMEYGRLGSLVLVVPSSLGRQKQRFISAYYPVIHESLRFSGGMFTPLNLFPLRVDPRFRCLNQRRIEHIQANNRFAQSYLHECSDQGSVLESHAFHHELFFTLSFGASSQQEVEEVIAHLCEVVGEAGFAVSDGASFGGDLLVLSYFKNLWNDEDVIRIAVPDIPREDVVGAVDVLYEALERWTLQHGRPEGRTDIETAER